MNSGANTRDGLSVVIPTWNGRALLEKFLPGVVAAVAAFEGTCHRPAEILLADDASSDDTLDWLARNSPQLRCESSAHNLGFAPTANRGIRAARWNLVYLLNNDVALDASTLPPLIDHFAEPEVFAVTSEAYDYDTGQLCGGGQWGQLRHGFLGIHGRYFVPAPEPFADAPFLTLYAGGGSSLFDRQKFLALGGFDELFAPFGWEDVELSLRAWKQGFQIRYEPRSRIWHRFSSTIGSRFSRRQVRAIYERNRLLAHWLHLDTRPQIGKHAFFLMLKLIGSPLVGRWEMWSAFLQALARRKEVTAQRQSLRARQQRTLRQVLDQIAAQLSRSEVHPLAPHTAPLRPYNQNSRTPLRTEDVGLPAEGD